MELRMNNGQSLSRCFPRCPAGRARRPRLPDREILDGILWILYRCRWHDLPDRYPSYQTCHQRRSVRRASFGSRLAGAGPGLTPAAVWISTNASSMAPLSSLKGGLSGKDQAGDGKVRSSWR